MTTELYVLQVFLYDEPIGKLTHLPGDKNLFTFDDRYIRNPARPILSLSFKDETGNLMTDIRITQTRLSPFFANLLPEGPLREYLAQRANVNPIHEFSLLALLGRDLPGAITVQPLKGENLSLLQEKKPKKKQTPFRFSLAGVQLKFSAHGKAKDEYIVPPDGTRGDWIVKLPHSLFRGIPENEYAMMELARRINIDVPKTALLPIRELHGLPKEFHQLGDHAFAIKRFDRAGDAKFHMEDFAQIFGVYPERKYKNASYRNIAEVIRKEVGDAGLVEFIKRFVFNALIGNGDMHLKNWSLLYKNKTKASLAPAYDFVSTILYLPEDRLALNFIDSKDFTSLTLDQCKRFAAKAHLQERLVLDTVQETVEAFSQAWKSTSDLPLDGEVRKAIDSHLKTIPLWNQF